MFNKFTKKFHNGYWNYRFKETIYEMDENTKLQYIANMRKILGPDYKIDNTQEIFYELIEVYYDEDGNIIAWSDNPAQIWSNCSSEIKTLIKQIKSALNKNTVVLEGDDLKDTGHLMRRTY